MTRTSHVNRTEAGLTEAQRGLLRDARQHPDFDRIMAAPRERVPPPLRVAGGILLLFLSIALAEYALDVSASALPPIAIAGAWALVATFVILGGQQLLTVYRSVARPQERRLAIVVEHQKAKTPLSESRVAVPVDYFSLVDEDGRRFRLESMGRGIDRRLCDTVGCLVVEGGEAVSFQPLS